MESPIKFKERAMQSDHQLLILVLCALALLSGLLSGPAAAEVVTVKEFYGHFGSGEPHRQSITIDLINGVVAETSIAACEADDREDFIKYPASVDTDFTDLGMVAFEGQIGLEDAWLERPVTEFLGMIYSREWGTATCPNKQRLG